MDWIKILNEIFSIFVVPLFGLLTIYLVKVIRVKVDNIKAKSNSELANKYMDLLTDTICNCVIATNQTYVDALKNENIFDGEAQKEAFKRTYEAILAILSDDARKYLENIYGDLTKYIEECIEAEVNKNKVRAEVE
jgi:hypothetical protein